MSQQLAEICYAVDKLKDNLPVDNTTDNNTKYPTINQSEENDTDPILQNTASLTINNCQTSDKKNERH